MPAPETQTPTPPQSGSKKNKSSRPSAPQRSDSELSSTTMDDQADDQSQQQARSRSQSRRRRRQNQRQRQSLQQQQQPQQNGQQQNGQQQQQQQGRQNLNTVEEDPDEPSPGGEMQPFEWIGPDSTSMNGPVTYARAQRGEIPMRRGNPNQSLATGPNPDQKGEGKSLMDEEGLKLKLELNLDIEIELKARLHGDLTLALL